MHIDIVVKKYMGIKLEQHSDVNELSHPRLRQMDGLRKSLGDILQALGQRANLLCNRGEDEGTWKNRLYMWKES